MDFIFKGLFLVNLSIFFAGAWQTKHSPNFFSIFAILSFFSVADLIVHRLISNNITHEYSYLWGLPMVVNWLICLTCLYKRNKVWPLVIKYWNKTPWAKGISQLTLNPKFYYIPIKTEKTLICFYLIWITFMLLEGIEQYGYVNIQSDWAQALVNGINLKGTYLTSTLFEFTINSDVIFSYQFNEIYSNAVTIKRSLMVVESFVCIWLAYTVYQASKLLKAQLPAMEF